MKPLLKTIGKIKQAKILSTPRETPKHKTEMIIKNIQKIIQNNSLKHPICLNNIPVKNVSPYKGYRVMNSYQLKFSIPHAYNP